MKHRISVDFIYSDISDFNSFWSILETEISKVSVVNMNEGTPRVEKSNIRKHNCNHDEVPVIPCGLETKIEK